MPRTRPTCKPLSYHRHTGQYYITRSGKRIYLGADVGEATKRYDRLCLRIDPSERPPVAVGISAKELANRFIAAQQANWREPETTLHCYRNWVGRFLKDHPRLLAADLTVEAFAAWKLSLRQRGYSPKAINHYLSAVRAMYAFAGDTELLATVPHLKRVKNESQRDGSAERRPLYTADHLKDLLGKADSQMKAMIFLGLNCGFGPKDIHDLRWDDIDGERTALPRSKTGVTQTYRLWEETRAALEAVRLERQKLIARLARRGRDRSDRGHVFVTKFWRSWSRDAVAEQFRGLCKAAGVPCYGFYRLRHCASTAVSLVAMPHVHRKFLRHRQLQQQVTYTHAPDEEVDAAIMRARTRLIGQANRDPGRSPGRPGDDGSSKELAQPAEPAEPGTPQELPA
jgi:integrase